MEEVVLWDLDEMDYIHTWELQKKLVAKKAKDRLTPDYLLFVEHPHVFTTGRKGNLENLLSRGKIPVYQVERGGDVTYHGPGQLVYYPIMDIMRREITVRDFVRALEEVTIVALGKLGIQAKRIDGYTGVWVGEKKIASIGVAVDHWVTFHGVALNVNTQLDYFFRIKPCGLRPDVMTSIEVIKGAKQEMQPVKKEVSAAFESVFRTKLIMKHTEIAEA